jgi:hypothetical protein
VNIILFVVWVWGGQYGEELILNFTLFFVRVRRRSIGKCTDTDCHCDYSKDRGR